MSGGEVNRSLFFKNPQGMQMHVSFSHRGGLCLGLACLLVASAAGCGGINWERDYQAGIQKAARNRKRALIEFTTMFGEGVSQMDSEVFSDPDVQEMMQKFVPIRLDIGLNRRLAERFGVQKTPAFVIVRPDMTVAGMHQGTLKADEFRHFLIKSYLN